ncbi:MAG: hypothetical protein GF331_27455 [Chitinivibrionales bacterium]|nr:hypothetical protein [Chitinivibrionales bacterium]
MQRARRTFLLIAVLSIATIITAGSGCFPPPPPRRAPAANVRKRPPKPHRNAIWVKGHWKRNRRTGARVWVKGYWKTPGKSQTKVRKDKQQTKPREEVQTTPREEEQTKPRKKEQTKPRY